MLILTERTNLTPLHFSSVIFGCISFLISPTRPLGLSSVDSHTIQIILVSEIILKCNVCLSSSNKESGWEREEMGDFFFF